MTILRNAITGEPLPVKIFPDTVTFRGKQYKVLNIAFIDECGEEFTTTESDAIWYNQATAQYRQEHGIPFPDEIKAVREKYGLSSAAMSEVLGFGANQWRLYEQGEVPSESNGKMIRSIMNPKVMLDIVEHSRDSLPPKIYDKTKSAINAIILQREEYRLTTYAVSRLYATPRNAMNGFAPLSLERLKNLLIYILNKCGELYHTQMNKLLFYIDFLSYKERAMAISGLSYRAIEFGPIPNRYERVYSAFDEIEQMPRMIHEVEGTVMTTSYDADITLFSEEEQKIINQVCDKLKGYSSRKLSELSHREDAWKNHQEKKEMIPFAEAFTLSAF